ncbi:MAG: RAP domain-containing protein, partial [Bacteroidota bacterium]|nr:RAP domain-containing protein [Bacteroidota bacterium]
QGLVIHQQYFVEGYFLDIFTTVNGQLFAIECEGARYHRVGGNRTGRLLGDDILKERILTQCGYKVIHILYEEWITIQDQQRWLRQKLHLD